MIYLPGFWPSAIVHSRSVAVPGAAGVLDVAAADERSRPE